jgi:hypothetical protein
VRLALRQRLNQQADPGLPDIRRQRPQGRDEQFVLRPVGRCRVGQLGEAAGAKRRDLDEAAGAEGLRQPQARAVQLHRTRAHRRIGIEQVQRPDNRAHRKPRAGDCLPDLIGGAVQVLGAELDAVVPSARPAGPGMRDRRSGTVSARRSAAMRSAPAPVWL